METDDAMPEDAWKLMMPCIGATSSLKILELEQYDGFGDRDADDDDYITDTVMLSLIDALLQNSTLEELDLSCSYFVTVNGWTALSRALSHSHSKLKRLVLRDCLFGDDIITEFANGLSSNGTLEVLNLTNAESTTTGLLAFAHLLGSPNSGLTELDLTNIGINDDVMIAFTNELRGNANSKLKQLDICYRAATLTATNSIWGPIKNLLCNTSSIHAALSSNHNLCRLNRFEIEEFDRDSDADDLKMPREISELLQLNECEDKKLVARTKVMKHYHSEDFDVNALIKSNQKLLPRKISWFGRDSVGLSVVYSIIRTLPDLCQNE